MCLKTVKCVPKLLFIETTTLWNKAVVICDAGVTDSFEITTTKVKQSCILAPYCLIYTRVWLIWLSYYDVFLAMILKLGSKFMVIFTNWFDLKEKEKKNLYARQIPKYR